MKEQFKQVHSTTISLQSQTTEQKPQTTDGIDFSKGLAEKVINQHSVGIPILIE